MNVSFDCLGHSSIKVNYDNKKIYIDPYNIQESKKDADIIFITHSHYDHFSLNDILKIRNMDTKIVIPGDIYNDTKSIGFSDSNIICVEPNKDYEIENIKFTTVPAYNIDKAFHPREKNWVGYLICLKDKKYYITGDTDMTQENKLVFCDVLFLPIGGIYTMDYKEASILANIIKPKIVVPIHYGSIVGTKEDATKFKELLDKKIDCKIFF